MATTGKTGSSSTIWIIGSLIVIAGGIGAYFLLKKPKEEGEKSEEELKREEEEKKKLEDEKNKVNEKPKDENPQQYVAPKTYLFPFKTKTEGNAFRVWVNTKYPDYAKKIDLSKSGELNSYVEKAWVVYGAEYTKNPSLTGTTPTGTTPTTTDANFNSQIQNIINKGVGNYTNKPNLLKQPPAFISAWSNALNSNKSYSAGNHFIFANQVYRPADGVKISTYNPIGKSHWAKNNLKARVTHNTSSESSSVTKGTKLGKVKSLWNTSQGLWYFMPDESYFYKWYLAKDVTTTPSSSFEGTNDHIEFSNFNNHLDLNF